METQFLKLKGMDKHILDIETIIIAAANELKLSPHKVLRWKEVERPRERHAITKYLDPVTKG